MLDTAEAVYTVDFTHDRLENIFYHSESVREFDLETVFPCSYDAYCLKQKAFVTENTRENYRIVESSAKLLNRFRTGEKQITVEYQEMGQNDKLISNQACCIGEVDRNYSEIY